MSSLGRVMVPIVAAAVLASSGAVGQGGNSIAGAACQESYTEGDFENRKPNYAATADGASFAFLAPMKAVAEGVELYSAELGGAMSEGVAALKGTIVRDGDGGIAIEALQLAWPFTVVSVNGQYQGVIQMAHEQGVSVGLGIASGDTSLGNIDFVKGAFDPAQPVVGFDPAAAAAIHDSLMGQYPMVFSLDVGGQAFSEVAPEPGAYGAFITGTLVPAMDEARRRDAEDPCTVFDDDTYLDFLDF